jgi:hypothetical protein
MEMSSLLALKGGRNPVIFPNFRLGSKAAFGETSGVGAKQTSTFHNIGIGEAESIAHRIPYEAIRV